MHDGKDTETRQRQRHCVVRRPSEQLMVPCPGWANAVRAGEGVSDARAGSTSIKPASKERTCERACAKRRTTIAYSVQQAKRSWRPPSQREGQGRRARRGGPWVQTLRQASFRPQQRCAAWSRRALRRAKGLFFLTQKSAYGWRRLHHPDNRPALPAGVRVLYKNGGDGH